MRFAMTVALYDAERMHVNAIYHAACVATGVARAVKTFVHA